MQSGQKGLRRRRSFSASTIEAERPSSPLLAEAGAPRASVLVVFGSGGHTAEMLALLAALPLARYAPRAFCAAASDATSEPRARASGAVPAGAPPFLRLPRAREVGQSYVTAVLSTLLALLAALRLVLAQQPHLVLVNGPGTCLPVCAAAVALRALGLLPRRCRVLFVESACRVETLSATGRLCYALGLADAVLVQWPQLRERYPRCEYVGLLS